ncbi:MAG: sigma-70 family RNA polymerase sigma factor [Planctomycetaceae bacterium]|nr:sigma-70 family RNA polymerase sigma factor [Planctomycetaceae bacterium]
MDSCNDCPKRRSCREICPAMEAKLPKEWDGRDSIFDDRPDRAERVENMLMNRVLIRRMLDHRECLTPAQREVFDLYYNDGLSQYQIAEKLGIRRNTVDEHLVRARERIARAAKGDDGDM